MNVIGTCGYWTIYDKTERMGRNRLANLCQCKCGTWSFVRATCLNNKETQSCGCVLKECAKKRFTKHGKHKDPIYRVWAAMLHRCTNPNNSRYKDYGGRGITVDPAWHDFQNFYQDMGDVPDGLQLDRIDNDGPYTKANCRWVTAAENVKNNRNTYTVNGVKMTTAEAAERIGISKTALSMRLRTHNLTLEEALQRYETSAR